MEHTLRERLNWLDRSEIVKILEERACIQCYDTESTELLRETLACEIEEGTIPEPEAA